MRQVKWILLGIFLTGVVQLSLAQKFLPGVYTFSKKKMTYLTLSDGTQVQGFLKDIDRTKGLIKNIELKSETGETTRYDATQVQEMYIAPSAWENFSRVYEFMYDPAQWDNTEYKQQLLTDGYVLFEQAEVEVGLKSRVLLLQLLNPSFSSHIKVYLDPWADETASVQIGGFEVAGGDKKSYYVKDGNRPAFQMKKSDYKPNFIALFGECADMVALKQKAKWNQFEDHIIQYNRCRN